MMHRVFYFMSHFRHRETKGYLYSNRKMALDYISNVVANQTCSNEPFSLTRRSTKVKRRKRRKRFRAKQPFIPSEKRSIISYGNASLQGTTKTYTPVPVKTITAISRRSLVILVDKFRTSVTCSRCHSTSEKKYRRQKEGEEHYKYLIYRLKVFPTCLDGKKIWHRDVNAAINNEGIMMDYINSQYDIKSRHPSLYRGTPPAVIITTATSS
ncbi:hypothetical protein BDF21DRAFT_423619 [Thamnidium elegans]|nr:hypothetical protein BDF21DRAFT_423619 [Thamnidium elegans]